ncbi:MAG: hypothetical protein SH856_03465 [Flavobacteriales bacterium]|nr:hypothetical protein [Flavobacteriales bacterium]
MKKIWQQNAQPENSRKLSGEELQNVMQHRTKDLLTALRKSLLFEYVVTIACFVVAIPFAGFAPRTDMKILASFVLVMCVFFGWYYQGQLKQLRTVQLYSGDVKSEITALHKRLSLYLKHYRLAYRILIPVSFVWGMVVGGRFTMGDTIFHFLQRPLIIAALIATTLIFIVVSDKLLSWYLNKLYGRHITRLQDVIHQLDEN